MTAAPIIGWYSPLLALFATGLSLHLLLRTRLVHAAADEANERSLHEGKIPRIGGLGIAIGLTASLIFIWPLSFSSLTIAACYGLLLLVSLFDDVYRLNIAPRLLMHAVVAAGAAAMLGINGVGFFFAVLALVWAANLYNFMDGSDGLAGGMSVIGFGCYAVLALQHQHPELALLCASISAAALAFLWFNVHPARLFMGDAGSIPLGFTAGLVGLFGYQQGCWSWWLPVVVFFPFIFDATYTLLSRILRREAFWQAHRQHIYQRAILGGLGHRKLALNAWGLMLISAALALLFNHRDMAHGGLIIGLQTVSGLFFAWRTRPIEILLKPARLNINAYRYLNPRSLIAIAHDLAWVSVTWIGLYALRFSFDAESVPRSAFVTLPIVLVVHLLCFLYFGLYQGMWRYASLHDLRRIGLAVVIAALIVPTLMLLWRYGHGVPRSVYILQPPLLLLFMAGGRIVYQWVKEELPQLGLRDQGKPVFLLAATDTSLALVDQFRRSANWRVVGVLDDLSSGRLLGGVPVLGTWTDLPTLARREGVCHAILSDRSIDHNTRRRAFDLCESAGVKLMLMPGVDDLLSGSVTYSRTREIELDDLLGRDPG